MKPIFGLLAMTIAMNTFAELSVPSGDFECAVTIEEHVDIVLEEGEDFPTFRGRFNPPIVRNEKLSLSFYKDGNEPAVSIKNPSILPNFLFVSEPFYNQGTSMSWENESGTGLVYQVDYSGTWYFGSTVQIETAAMNSSGTKMKVHVTFDDNDGWSATQKWVKCIKK